MPSKRKTSKAVSPARATVWAMTKWIVFSHLKTEVFHAKSIIQPLKLRLLKQYIAY